MSVVAGKRDKSKGQRARHIPQRMCISCRERSAKRILIRIVRTPEGQVEVDPSGRKNGRGAYLCDQSLCWERAITNDMLGKALNTEIDEAALLTLREFAETLINMKSPTGPAGVAQSAAASGLEKEQNNGR